MPLQRDRFSQSKGIDSACQGVAEQILKNGTIVAARISSSFSGTYCRSERRSLPLAVSGPYRELFEEFRGYFEAEVDALGDETLNQELGILNTLGGPAAD